MYLEIDEGFAGHRKTLRLCASLKNPEAPWYVMRLWTWACRSCPDGDLTGTEPYDIEIACGYRALDGLLYAAMVAAGFIDEQGGHPSAIHNWAIRTGAAIQKMAEEAARKKGYRAHRDGKCGPDCPHPHPGVSHGQSADGALDSPAPVLRNGNGLSHTDQTSPDQTSPDQSRESPARAPAIAGAPPPAPRTAGLWHAHDWFLKFGAAWCLKYQTIAYGNGAQDPKHVADLGDYLGSIPDAARLDLQQRAPGIFASYLGDSSPGRLKARHPFAFFARDFRELAVPALPNGNGAGKGNPYCELHRQPGSHGKLPRAGPDKGCPECKHVLAAKRIREGEPAPIDFDELSRGR